MGALDFLEDAAKDITGISTLESLSLKENIIDPFTGKTARDAAGKAAEAAETAGQAAITEQRLARESAERRTQPFESAGVAVRDPLLNMLGIVKNPRLAELEQALKDIPVNEEPFIAAVARNKIQREIDATPPTIQGNQLSDGSFAPPQEFTSKGVDDFNLRQFDLPEFEAFDPSTEERLAQINPVADFLQKEGFRQIREAGPGRNVDRDLSEFQTGLTSTLVPQFDALNLNKRRQQSNERGQAFNELFSERQQGFNEQFNLENQNLSKRQQRFGELFNVLGIGANTAVRQGSQGINTASNIGNLQTGIGAAQGAGFMGEAAGRIQGAQNVLSGISSAFGAAGGTPTSAVAGFTRPPQSLTQQGNPLGGGLPTDLNNPGQVFA